MKVTSTKNQSPQPPSTRKAESSREPGSAANPGDDLAAQPSPRRDFASILDEVSHPREESDARSGVESRDASPPERNSFERQIRRRRRDEGEETRQGVGFASRGGIAPQVETSSEATTSRPLLRIADLERIVAAIQTQIIAGGRHEVTLDLSRTVLEGLRIKLSSGEAGGIHAEFVAASEKIRALLDHHSQALADLLREHGIDIASLKTSVSTDSAGQDNAGGRGQRYSPPVAFERASRERISASTGSSEESSEAATDNTGEENPTTKYRA